MIDALVKAVASRGPVCVGLDTSMDYIPESMLCDDVTETMFRFNRRIIDATKDVCAVYKLQIAYYEAQGIAGMKAYQKTLEYLRHEGVLSIGDIKRGDIAATAKEYAKAHFDGDFGADFITLNPYMGFDSIEPYEPYFARGDKGAFVLLRTSNPGAKDIEYKMVDGEHLYYQIGDAIEKMGEKYQGTSGYSAIGMVVGGTHSDEAEEIRKRYPNTFFLIPGYGAQGGKAEDIRRYLNDGNGGVVNSSRGIIARWKKEEDGEARFDEVTRNVVLEMRRDICGE